MVKKRYLLIPTFLISFASAEITNLSEAINKSNQQKILSQLILKDMAMVKSENFYDNPYEDFDIAVEKFENNLNDLLKFNKNSKTKKDLLSLKKKWEIIQNIFEDDDDEDDDDEETSKLKVNKEENIKSMIQLEKKLNNLLILTEKINKDFISQNKGKSKKIINVIDEQIMLSQRMAALYLIKSLGADNKDISEKLNISISEFKNGLDILKNESLNNKEIKKSIQKVEKSFVFFEVMNKTSNKFIPTLIYKKSKIIYKNMNNIRDEYLKIEEEIQNG